MPQPDLLPIALLCLALPPATAQQPAPPQPHTLRSPDGRLVLRIATQERFAFDLQVDDTTVIRGATLSLTIDGRELGVAPQVESATARSHDEVLQPPVPQKAAQLRDHYRELRFACAGGYAVSFRAFDQGIAWRFETALPQPQVTVDAEHAGFRFAGDYRTWFAEEQGFFSHNERHYLPRPLGDLGPQDLGSLPAVVDAGTCKLAIAEADVDDYPGLWLRGAAGTALAADFPRLPLREQLRGDRDLLVTERGACLARTAGTRSYPWRLCMVARRDGDLLQNQLPWLLASPSRIDDTGWIRPGKVAWDWWNANNLYGVDFQAGVNTATYRHFIDFAADHGIEYVILDEGWYELGDVLKVVPAIDLPALCAHAQQRGVGLILWVVWKTLDDQLEPAMQQFERWGVKGIKVDFMQRDDQLLMQFYHRLCRAAAQHHLLVDFHGSQRPALLTRTWPNLLSTEGVRGLEWNKWSAHVDPEHDATLPFTRMLLGPMDYTPGAMRNAARGAFAPQFATPMSQGTRCHQLALYVVYDSPLQMLADSPSNYAREAEAMAFLRAVPTVWEETRVLDARIGDYVLLARRRGERWFVGGITDWTPRGLELDLSFLPAGEFTLEAWTDGPNAERNAVDCLRRSATVGARSRLPIHLAAGGGYAAIVSPRR